MLSKCANPECTTPFLYLHQGKLFRIEVENREAEDVLPRVARRRTEYYWLCDRCSVKMTLQFRRGSGVVAVPLAARKAAS
ncbi:MAG TPA: hypothetical protein VGF08_12940 [Terriglobales bacterium]